MWHKKRRDNRGITLVEVIVSMLVLAIIVVPLLSSFVLSSRINVKARSKQYATTLAQNVMESLKNFDLEEIALQFNDVASGRAFLVVPKSTIKDARYKVGYYEAKKDEWDKLEEDETKLSVELNSKQWKGNSDRTYYYAINDVKEGTKQFDVRITVSANANYDVVSGSAIKQNLFEIPNVTNLDINETALINPSSVGITYNIIDGEIEYNETEDTYGIKDAKTYDLAATNYFITQHHNYGDQVYKKECDEIQKIALEKGEIPVYEPRDPDKPDVYIRQKISRKTIINIDKTLNANEIRITAKLEYKFNQGTESLIYDKDSPLTPDNDTKVFSGFFENVVFADDKLKNIYLFHTPLKLGAWYSNDDLVEPQGDVIEINNPTDCLKGNLHIFIAKQKMLEGTLDLGYTGNIPIKIKATGYKDNLRFYYENFDQSTENLYNYNGEFELNDSNYDQTLVTSGASKDRIHEVKVQIMEHGSNEVLSELVSTLTR